MDYNEQRVQMLYACAHLDGNWPLEYEARLAGDYNVTDFMTRAYPVDMHAHSRYQLFLRQIMVPPVSARGPCTRQNNWAPGTRRNASKATIVRHPVTRPAPPDNVYAAQDLRPRSSVSKKEENRLSDERAATHTARICYYHPELDNDLNIPRSGAVDTKYSSVLLPDMLRASSKFGRACVKLDEAQLFKSKWNELSHDSVLPEVPLRSQY